MKPIALGLFRPKHLLAVIFGLLLVLGACLSSNPEQQSDSLLDSSPQDSSSLSSLFVTIFDAVKSWTDSAVTKDSSKTSGTQDSSGVPSKMSSNDPGLVEAKAASPLSIIELEAKKAQALRDQRNGNPCENCVDDGEGNLLPPELVQSIRVQKARSRVVRSQVEPKGNGDAPESSISHDQDDQDSHEMLSSDSSEDSSSNSKSKLRLKNGVTASSQRRQLSKSKNNFGIVNPGIPFPTNCRCEYPGERIYTFVNQPINVFKGGILILPGSSIYCLNVDFICPDDDPPTGSVRFTCPNLNTGVIVNNKGKGKGNKNGNVILGNGVVGGVGIIGNGLGFTNLGGKSKCGKGKGNKGINNCGVIIPPQVPSRPQYEVLPATDPDCRDRPTPRPIGPSPPKPTPGAPPPRCQDEYNDWIDCVNDSKGCANCQPTPNEPGGWLNPREECDEFVDWFPNNFECCLPCDDELKDFEFCKDCSLPSPVRPPTRRPTPPRQTPRPTPPRGTPRPTPRRNRPTPRPTPRRSPPAHRPPAVRSSDTGSGPSGVSSDGGGSVSSGGGNISGKGKGKGMKKTKKKRIIRYGESDSGGS